MRFPQTCFSVINARRTIVSGAQLNHLMHYNFPTATINSASSKGTEEYGAISLIVQLFSIVLFSWVGTPVGNSLMTCHQVSCGACQMFGRLFVWSRGDAFFLCRLHSIFELTNRIRLSIF